MQFSATQQYFPKTQALGSNLPSDPLPEVSWCRSPALSSWSSLYQVSFGWGMPITLHSKLTLPFSPGTVVSRPRSSLDEPTGHLTQEDAKIFQEFWSLEMLWNDDFQNTEGRQHVVSALEQDLPAALISPIHIGDVAKVLSVFFTANDVVWKANLDSILSPGVRQLQRTGYWKGYKRVVLKSMLFLCKF